MKGLRYSRHDVWQPVAELWDIVLANSIHSPFCSCRGPGGMSFDADMIEQDLIDYLEPRYRTEGWTQLADILDRRAMEPRSGFVDWLREVSSSMPGQDRMRLIDDIIATLSSMSEASSGSGFLCR